MGRNPHLGARGSESGLTSAMGIWELAHLHQTLARLCLPFPSHPTIFPQPGLSNQELCIVPWMVAYSVLQASGSPIIAFLTFSSRE